MHDAAPAEVQFLRGFFQSAEGAFIGQGVQRLVADGLDAVSYTHLYADVASFLERTRQDPNFWTEARREAYLNGENPEEASIIH